tara:strand:+ start:524 stop:715 length:192 start_codon:yes stop_codon:yes gene_type:complete
MNTTEKPVVIGTVNGSSVILEEGKGDNDSVLSHAGKKTRQGFAELMLGKEVADIYAAWHAANR